MAPRWCSWRWLGRAAALAAAWRSAAAVPRRRLALLAQCVVRSARRLAPSARGRRRGRFLSTSGGRRAALAAPLRRRLALSSWCAAISGAPSLRLAVGAVAFSFDAVAVAPLSRRRCLRRRVGAPGLPRPRRRACGGVALGRRSFAAAARALGVMWRSRQSAPSVRGCRSPARSLLLWGWWVSRGARDAAAGGAALALLALAWSCRHTRDGVTLGRRSSTAAARSLRARGASCSAARALCVWSGGRSPSRGARDAAACGVALALLAPFGRAAAFVAA